jgi:hypothetical protein
MAGSKPGHDNEALGGAPHNRKVPPCGGTFLLSPNWCELATALALLILALLVGLLALTVRILLLLSWLLAATLLLAGLGVLLTRLLILLARFLILVGHRDLPGCTPRPW